MEAKHAAPLFLGYSALRLGFLLYLYFVAASGFYFWSGDYPTRLLEAAQWARQPAWNLGSIWLPFSCYLNGMILKAWPDLGLGPTLFHILLSGGVLAWLYLIACRLWGNPWYGLLSALWIGLDPHLAQLGISGGASELDFQFLLLGGTYVWLKTLKENHPRNLWLSVLLFSLAGATRHEAWCFMVWPTASIALGALRGRSDRRALAAAFIGLALMWLPAVIWLAAHAKAGQYPLVPFSEFAANLREGIRVPEGARSNFWTEALWMYPRALWSQGKLECLVAAAAAARAWKATHQERAYVAFIVVGLVFLMFTPLFSAVLPSFLGQITLHFRLLLAPLAARLLCPPVLFEAARSRCGRAALAVLTAVFFLWRVPQAYALAAGVDATRASPLDLCKVAVVLKTLRAQSPRILFELHADIPRGEGGRSWALNVLRYANPDVWPDRGRGKLAYKIKSRPDGSGWIDFEEPSLFELPERTFAAQQRRQGIGLAVVHSAAAQRKASGVMESGVRIGEYHILVAKDRPKLAAALREAAAAR